MASLVAGGRPCPSVTSWLGLFVARGGDFRQFGSAVLAGVAGCRHMRSACCHGGISTVRGLPAIQTLSVASGIHHGSCRWRFSDGSEASKAFAFMPDPRGRSMSERGFISRDAPRENRYWPPTDHGDDESPIVLPGGRKQVAVRAMKRDVDGYLEAQICIETAGGHRLFWLSEEELSELEKLAPRLTEYMGLWQEKLEYDQQAAQEAELEKLLEAGVTERIQ